MSVSVDISVQASSVVVSADAAGAAASSTSTTNGDGAGGGAGAGAADGTLYSSQVMTYLMASPSHTKAMHDYDTELRHRIAVTKTSAPPRPVDDSKFSFAFTGRHDGGELPLPDPKNYYNVLEASMLVCLHTHQS